MQLQARHIAIVTCLPVCLSVRQSHSCTMRKRLGSPSYFCITWQNRLFHIKYLYKTPTDFKSDIDTESVQRRFTTRLRFLNNMSYSRRLVTLGLEILEARRLHQDLLLTYKIVFGLINIDSSNFFILRRNSITRGHNFKLFLSHSRVDVRKYFFVSVS